MVQSYGLQSETEPKLYMYRKSWQTASVVNALVTQVHSPGSIHRVGITDGLWPHARTGSFFYRFLNFILTTGHQKAQMCANNVKYEGMIQN